MDNFLSAAPRKKTETISNGRVTSEVNVNGSQLMFACNIGYTLQGPRTLFCSNGIWSPAEPTVCKDKQFASISIAKKRWLFYFVLVVFKRSLRLVMINNVFLLTFDLFVFFL